MQMTEILNGFEKCVDIYRDYNNYLDSISLMVILVTMCKILP